MPGFVDVSNMTAKEIQRMGHADDHDDMPQYRGRRASSYNKPAVQVGYAVSDVWAAACAAQRINGGYFKEEQWMQNATPPYIAKRRNRDVMMDFLRGAETLTDQDREAGEQVRNWLQNDLTFRAVKGRLTEFDASVSKCLAVEDRFYTVSHRYELAVVACLPNSAAKSQQRQETDARVKFAQGGHIGTIGAKVMLKDVEVLSAVYSQQYNIYWIRGVTDQDQPVTFSNKEKFDVGIHLTIQGKVKAHRDSNLTQLNYVKVL